MSTISQTMRRVIRRRDASDDARPVEEAVPAGAEGTPGESSAATVDIAPNDPLVTYLQTAGGACLLYTSDAADEL